MKDIRKQGLDCGHLDGWTVRRGDRMVCFSCTVRDEATESRELVGDMLREIQDLALHIRVDIAISESPEKLLAETHRIQNLLGKINTQIRGYGRHWL